MNEISSENKFCESCMNEHEVKTVEVSEMVRYKDEMVIFNSIHEYCEDSNEMTETEDMESINSYKLEQAYEEKMESN